MRLKIDLVDCLCVVALIACVAKCAMVFSKPRMLHYRGSIGGTVLYDFYTTNRIDEFYEMPWYTYLVMPTVKTNGTIWRTTR